MKKSSLFPFLASSLSLLNACGGGGGTPAPPAQTSVTPPDQTSVHFSVSGPANSPSGTSFNFTVTALDPSNKLVTAYFGTVHFTSTDPHAQLPSDSTLASGSKVFPAKLTTAGNQVITATDTATASIAGRSNSINVGALADAFPVETFGAKGDGKTDDTAAIQSAINAAAAAGGGSVVFGVARYFTSGRFLVPQGVVLSGVIEGPFDVEGINPAATAVAPSLLVTNSSGPFLTLQGIGAGVTNLLFHYPNQVKSSADAPAVYPYTILVTAPGTKVARSTVTNAYNFLDFEVGRTMAQDLFIGAYNIGVNIDHVADFIKLHNLHNGVFWDEVENATYPTAIDRWVLNHGIALVVGRMDAGEVSDFFAFSRFAGIFLADSPDTTEPGCRCGWGTGSDIKLEAVQYGIIATASSVSGYEFTNVVAGAAPGLGQAAVQLRAGGTAAPDVLINGGSARGSWALSPFPAPLAGHLTVVNVMGFDLP